VGFRALFLLPTVAGVTAAITVALLVRESPVRSRRRVRVLPAVALAGWLVTALLAISGAPRAGWMSPRTLGLLGAAAVLLAAWVLIESRIDVPLIDLTLLVDRRVAGANVVALLIGISMYASFGFLPQLTQTPAASGYGIGASVALSGYLTLPTAAMSFLGGLSSPWLGERVGRHVLITLGCCLSATGLLSISLAHHHVWQFLLANSLTGLGSGFVFAALANVVVAAAPLGSTSVAAGLNANLRTIGGSIGSAVMASIVTHQLLPSGWPAESGYTLGFALLAVASLVAGVVASRIPQGRTDPDRSGWLDERPIRPEYVGEGVEEAPPLLVRTSE